VGYDHDFARTAILARRSSHAGNPVGQLGFDLLVVNPPGVHQAVVKWIGSDALSSKERHLGVRLRQTVLGTGGLPA
jgi:hypothetical protein